MDAQQFDRFTRALAVEATRRRVLFSALAASASFILGRGGRRAHAQACTSFLGLPCASDSECGSDVDPACAYNVCCSGACVDVLNDPNNCDGCGRVCPAGATCSDGVCGSPCPPGQTYCDVYCADLSSDPVNCGACGSPCLEGQLCCGGTCIPQWSDPANCGACGFACNPGESCCPNGCLDLQSDNNACGACDQACAPGQRCCAGACVDLGADPANCGDCGIRCGESQTCQAGTCVAEPTPAPSCPPGQAPCPGGCAPLDTDPANCGACGHACDTNLTCCAGTCVDLQTDIANCGECGMVCQPGSVCETGRCVIREQSSGDWIGRAALGPDFCLVEPNPRIVQLADDPSSFAKPNGISRPPLENLTPGPTVDLAIAAAVQETLLEASACANAGDFARQAALWTDEWLDETLARLTFSIPERPALPPAPLPPPQWAAVVGISEITVAGEGLVRVAVTTDDPMRSPAISTAEIILKEINGRWLIDRVLLPGHGLPLAKTASLTLEFHRCPAGMTASKFVADACPPAEPPGFRLVGQEHQGAYGPGTAVRTGPARFAWEALPFGTYELQGLFGIPTVDYVIPGLPVIALDDGTGAELYQITLERGSVVELTIASPVLFVYLFEDLGACSTPCPPCTFCNRTTGQCEPVQCPPCDHCEPASGVCEAGCEYACGECRNRLVWFGTGIFASAELIAFCADSCAPGDACDGRCCTRSGQPCGSGKPPCCFGADCVNGTCAPCRRSKAICVNDSDCCSGVCQRTEVEGYCLGRLGDPCYSGDPCAGNAVCGPGNICCLPISLPCRTGAECCSGICDPATLTCQPRAEGACTRESDCASDQHCLQGRCCSATGQACAQHAECCSGVCDPSLHVCVGTTGTHCEATIPCAPGFTCHEGRCCANAGIPCDYPRDCCSGICDWRTHVCK